MAPSAYQPFFAASMGAAAALLGLLFVAVSIAPDGTVGPGAPVERQVVAESVFTALINAFFVSMGGTIPDVNLGAVALTLSAFSLFQTLHVGRRLWLRRIAIRSLVRRLTLVVAALAIYGLQFNDASHLVRVPPQGAPVGSEPTVLFAIYAFAIGRSWELLGARRGILSTPLSPAMKDDGEHNSTARPRTQPSVTTEAPDLAADDGTKNN